MKKYRSGRSEVRMGPAATGWQATRGQVEGYRRNGLKDDYSSAHATTYKDLFLLKNRLLNLFVCDVIMSRKYYMFSESFISSSTAEDENSNFCVFRTRLTFVGKKVISCFCIFVTVP